MRPAEVPSRSDAALLAVLPAHVPQCTLRGLLARALPETGSKLLPGTSECKADRGSLDDGRTSADQGVLFPETVVREAVFYRDEFVLDLQEGADHIGVEMASRTLEDA